MRAHPPPPSAWMGGTLWGVHSVSVRVSRDAVSTEVISGVREEIFITIRLRRASLSRPRSPHLEQGFYNGLLEASRPEHLHFRIAVMDRHRKKELWSERPRSSCSDPHPSTLQAQKNPTTPAPPAD